MTKQFDRTESGDKLHMQSLGAMAHFDYNQPATYSYEQAFQVLKQLALPTTATEELFRRMAFNIVARNQDDHVKNIAFLMNKSGTWSLSPAHDMTYAYDPDNLWLGKNQMSMNGKREGFLIEVFEACGKTISLKRGLAESIVREVQTAVSNWTDIAQETGVSAERIQKIRDTHRVFDL